MKTCLVCEGISDTTQEFCTSCGLPLVSTSEVHFPMRRGEADAAHPLLGSVVGGKYRITNVVGKGGMGTVFSAVHEISLVPVALKILHPRFAARADHRRYFLEEARKAGRVSHEHTARVLDVGEDNDGTVYIAMELVNGSTLAEWIHDSERLGPALVVDILYQVCQALAAAHAVGLVHRDLSPRNVMCEVRDGKPFVKILDFGISKSPPLHALLSGDARPVAPRGFANPPYSAPEHLEGDEVDARADLYSLGVIAYEALTQSWPVAGNTAPELARATLEGDLRPLRAPAGTPGRLQRLIQRMLARNPDDRPANAREVMRLLDRIRHPRVQLLRAAATVSLIAALPAFVVAYAIGSVAYMTQLPGSRLSLSEQRSSAVQQLRRDQLEPLRFSIGGFDARDLELVAYGRNGAVVGRLTPDVDADRGELTLSSTTAPAFGQLLDRLAVLAEPVELVFRTPGRKPFYHGRILLDDAGPELSLRGPERACIGASELSYTVADHGALSSVGLEVTWVDNGISRAKTIALPQEKGQFTVRCVDVFSKDLTAITPYRDVTLRLRAVDAAGNDSVGEQVLRLEQLDLAAPEIVDVYGRLPRILTYGSVAGLWVKLARFEDDLKLLVSSDDFPQQIVALAGTGQERKAALRPRDSEPRFPDGEYEFVIRDRAGNSSQPFRASFEFKSEDHEGTLEVEDVGDRREHAVVSDRGPRRRIFSDGQEVELTFRCNDLYHPTGAWVRLQGGSDRELPGEFAAAGPRRWLLMLPGPLPDGLHELTIELADQPQTYQPSLGYELLVRRGPLKLELPRVRGRFLRQYVAADLLAQDGSDRVRLGGAWRLEPDDVRLLRGQIWFGQPGSLLKRPLAVRRESDSPLLPSQPLLPGENLIVAELRDALQRPVDVRVGGAPAREVVVEHGASGRLVADFWYHPEAPAPVRESFSVEYGGDLELVIRSPLPFAAEDDLVLRLASSSEPVMVSPEGSGSLLRARIRYRWIAESPELRGVPPQDFAGRRWRMLATLETPAGDYDLKFDVVTVTSKLRPVECSELARAELVPGALLNTVMIPVVAPPGHIYRDPVPDDLNWRADFRPQQRLSVRNVDDVFLQAGEMTRRQYRALMRAFSLLPAEQRDAGRLVHAWDPLGAGRLQALEPGDCGGALAPWARRLAEGPDRPVTGVNFFQAYTLARIAGWLLRRDPDLFRLPMGIELERAALGATGDDGPVLNGVLRNPPLMTIEDFYAFSPHAGDPGRWPPDFYESRAAGDMVETELGYQIVALDFGVREWVLDLPYLASGPGNEVLTEWRGDHGKHLERVLEFARGITPPPQLAGVLAARGVVRGAVLGEAHTLIETRPGRELPAHAAAELPPGVPGVVRTLMLPRSGSDPLFDDADPRLRNVGFRMAGGRAFVAEVRR